MYTTLLALLEEQHQVTEIISYELLDLCPKKRQYVSSVPIAIVTSSSNDVIRLGEIDAPTVSVFGDGMVVFENLKTKCVIVTDGARVILEQFSGSILSLGADSITVWPVKTDDPVFWAGYCNELVFQNHSDLSNIECKIFVEEFDKFSTYHDDDELTSGFQVSEGDRESFISSLHRDTGKTKDEIQNLIDGYSQRVVGNSRPASLDTEKERFHSIEDPTEVSVSINIDGEVSNRLEKIFTDLSNNELRSLIESLFPDGVVPVDTKKYSKSLLAAYMAGVADGKAQNYGTDVVQDPEKPYRDVLHMLTDMIRKKYEKVS